MNKTMYIKVRNYCIIQKTEMNMIYFVIDEKKENISNSIYR